MRYQGQLHAVLTPVEHKVFAKLSTPHKVQDYLDSLPINFELAGDGILSPRQVVAQNTAHCVEGALLAAAAMAYHGAQPLLLDIQSTAEDFDHVVALFKVDGHWGAISKTNHAILRWRDPVYRTVRELAMSYFNEYFLEHGRKTMRAYSAPFNLAQFGVAWVTATEDRWDVIAALDESPHYPIAPPEAVKKLRRVSPVEIKLLDPVEWEPPQGADVRL